MSEMLKGVFDMHVHTSPDVQHRKCNDVELAERLKRAGMAGCAIKNHFFDTSGRAAVTQSIYPELKIVGGIVLNLSHGGLNPYAVERMVQMKGKMLWFPTMDALAYKKFHSKDKTEDLSRYITIFDGKGEMLPTVGEILDIAAAFNLIVGTGHLGADEGMALVRESKRRGVKHIVLTHADNPSNRYSLKQQAEATALGATIEHCYFTTYYNKTKIEDIIGQINYIGYKHVVLSTDFGQTASPYSDEGMSEYMKLLIANGISKDAVIYMTSVNPLSMIES